jgi:hypothetical protein
MNMESKYPELKNVSRIERDQIILNALEVIANELERISKVVKKIEEQI